MNKNKDILQSIERGFQEVKEYKTGKRKLNSLEESMKRWKKWLKEEISRENIKIISSEEALKDVIPFEWTEDVLTGKTKVIIDK